MQKNSYKSILLFDTSIVTENLGDYIIMDAVESQLRNMFPDSFVVHAPTHDVFGAETKKWSKEAEYTFIGGTNLLTNRFRGRTHSQWRYGFRDFAVKNAIGIGMGWQSDKLYNRFFDVPLKMAQSFIYNNSLSNTYIHSVRDSFTQHKLSEMGINSINTACVTMWSLTNDLLGQIPKTRMDTVVTTITNYWKTPEYLNAYKKIIEILLDNYSTVKLWIQAEEDFKIFQSLNILNKERVEFISPNLAAFDDALNQPVDYIGTRLHAGIRALQHKKRALIIELDNRAREISKDTNLPTVNFRDTSGIKQFIGSEVPMDIHVPFDQIDRWKSQFRN